MSVKKLNYDDVSEGMEFPEIIKGPIARKQLVDYASASGDYNKIHYDDEFAKKAGLPGCIAHGMLVMAIVGSCIEEWAGNGVLKSYKISFRGMTIENDTLTIKGKIVKKYTEGNENLVEINVTSETQNNVMTTQGSAILAI